jgi:outer membrane protein assembly factor BamE
MLFRALAAIATLFLVSCGSGRLSPPVVSPYRMEIQQGNFVSQEMMSQLKLGMSKDQVRFVMGTPLITDSFHADRWDYVFRRQKPSSRELEHHKLAVFFEDGKLARIESDVTPGASADVAAVKTPEAKSEAPAPKPEVTAPKPEAAAPKPEVTTPKPEAPAPKPVATALKLDVQKQQSLGAVPESKPAGQAAAEVPKPAPAAAPEKSAATPEKPAAMQAPSGDKQAEEKKGWWDRLKDKVKF